LSSPARQDDATGGVRTIFILANQSLYGIKFSINLKTNYNKNISQT